MIVMELEEHRIIRNKIRSTLKEHYGEFNTKLEKEYEDVITNKLFFSDIINKRKWVTYNQLVIYLNRKPELLFYLKELLYRITDNENPKKVCIDILMKLKDSDEELDRLYHKIKGF